jgi:hypothetical protein
MRDFKLVSGELITAIFAISDGILGKRLLQYDKLTGYTYTACSYNELDAVLNALKDHLEKSHTKGDKVKIASDRTCIPIEFTNEGILESGDDHGLFKIKLIPDGVYVYVRLDELEMP